MKADIHPKLNHVVFVDSSSKAEFPTLSTLSSKETRKINGVDHFVIRVEISSASHPFYTGKQTLVDTAGRVDRFKAKMEAAKKLQEKAKAGKAKKEAMSKETPEEKISRKAKENTEKKEAEKAEMKKPAVKKAPAKKPVAKKKETVAKKAPAKKPAAKKKA
ncbi:type B 50S ribosomal protein L31 [Patescibacteria group bacterium]|nr:type B 50S ribosomal protein L31 [Patescibacteria group bacterium]MBU1016215.1 type B 50S ribosomal protein L31 [Patescibacteria group bacterium]MBU1684668.1 type B 50S ribosomal protein L31 [Patescibacteria group bacterium]MBU1938919.1 type B 50S ribosomal protein L31 [Patescibacteria group bacterium]